ncbi:MAG: metallophosphoesterase [Oscillospiraceae bacterium]|nr:metallophosphoesterase [Oscillospiraceae bacterium]
MKSVFWKNNRKKIIILVIFVILLISGLYNKLKIQYYTIESEKITNPVRIVLVTDLHSCQYGEQQQELIQAVREQKPDLIALSGDIFDDILPDANTEYFLKGIAEDYPCYYVTGNHEYYAGVQAYDAKMAILEKYHVNILSGTEEIAVCNQQKIIFYGIEDSAAGLKSNKQLKKVIELSLIHISEPTRPL